MNVNKPGCPINVMATTNISDDEKQGTQVENNHVLFPTVYTNLKYAILQRASLSSEARSPHNQFNDGQRYDNPNFTRTVKATCRFVLSSGAIRDGITLHKKYGPEYVDKLSGPSKWALGGGVSAVHIALSGTSTIYGGVTLWEFFRNNPNTAAENKFGAVFNFIWHGSDFLGDVSEELDRLTLVAKGWKYFNSLHKIKFLGKASFGLEILSSVGAIQELRSIMDDKAPMSLKVAAVAETTLGILSSLTKTAVDAMWIDKVRQGLKITGKAPFVALGAALIGATLHPLQFYSIHKEFDYAQRLDSLAKEFSSRGYDGYQLLAELYKNKAIFDTVTTSLQTFFSLAGGGVSLAMMASVVGAPLGIALQLITTTLSVITDAIEQPVLEAIAKKQRNLINTWEKNNGGESYFSKQLDAYYEADKSQLGKFSESLQQLYKADQVVNIYSISSDAQLRELAAITKLSEKSLSGSAYIDIFQDSKIKKSKEVSLDVETGVIELRDNDLQQILTFTQPLLTPGKEIRVRDKAGKNKYKTSLTLSSKGDGWKIFDKGTATRTIADFSSIVQRINMKDNSIREISINAEMGSGNDLIKASMGSMTVNGDDGIDVMDYSHFSDKTKIKVQALENGGYAVIKNFNDCSAFEERIISESYHYGKRTDSIEYRDIFIKKVKQRESTDILLSIEEVVGTPGNDQMMGGAGRDVFYGKDGDDQLFGFEGNDVLYGGKGNDRIVAGLGDDLIFQNIDLDEDFICGGEGIDTLDYSITTFKNIKGRRGIEVDLDVNDIKGGTVIKYIYSSTGNLVGKRKDAILKIENIIGTFLDDVIDGDNNNNVFSGLQGNDRLYGQEGDDTLIGEEGDDFLYGGNGQDKLFGGLGRDLVNGDSDDDEIYQSGIDGDILDGGDGEDTVNYALMNKIEGVRTKGILLDLKKGKSKEDISEKLLPMDTLKNIENVIATKWNDILYGDDINNKLDGGDGDDVIRGFGGDDFLLGQDGDDVLFGGRGNDVVYAGRGKDKVYGEDGNDLIYQNFGVEGDLLDGGRDDDTVDYSLSFKRAQSVEGLQDHQGGIEINLEQRWAKKNAVNTREIKDILLNIENAIGTSFDDKLVGDQKSNLLKGGYGKDTLYGNDGNDVLYGDEDDDILYGGAGNDQLFGGVGSDIYHFARGGKRDVIYDEEGSADVLQFAEGVSEDEIRLKKQDNDLIISIYKTEDSVAIHDYFLDSKYRVEKIQLSNGKEWSFEVIDKLTEEMGKLVSLSALSSTPFSTPMAQPILVIASVN